MAPGTERHSGADATRERVVRHCLRRGMAAELARSAAVVATCCPLHSTGVADAIAAGTSSLQETSLSVETRCLIVCIGRDRKHIHRQMLFLSAAVVAMMCC